MIALWLWLARRYPFTRGRDWFFRHFAGPESQVASRLSALPNPVAMRGGFVLHTYGAADYTSRWFRLYRDYEGETAHQIEAHLPQGSAFLDLGANLGIFSIGLATQRPDLQVYAFEPNPATHALLTESVEANRLVDRVTVFNRAVSDEAGRLPFIQNLENSGDSVLVGDSEDDLPEGDRVDVEVVVLDQLEPVLNSQAPIGLVKMDIQGAELKALRGMVDLIQKHRPAFVIEATEDSLERFGATLADLLAFFEAQGYRRTAEFENNWLVSPR